MQLPRLQLKQDALWEEVASLLKKWAMATVQLLKGQVVYFHYFLYSHYICVLPGYQVHC